MKIKTPALITWQKTIILTHLTDTLEFKKIDERKIKITRIKGYKIPTNDKNPVFRAAAEIQKMKPNKLGVEIRITKNIPSSCGLNSMSGNAAGTILVLDKMWNFKLSRKKMYEIASKINPETVQIQKLHFEPLAQNKKYVIIIIPKYIKTDRIWLKKKTKIGKTMESVAMEYFPDLRTISEVLEKYGFKSIGMSGKGPSLFGFSDKPIILKQIKKELKCKTEFMWYGKTCNKWGKLLE